MGRRQIEPRAGDGIEVIGRLAPGVGIDDARTEMSVIAARLRETHRVNRNLDIRVIPLFDQVLVATAAVLVTALRED